MRQKNILCQASKKVCRKYINCYLAKPEQKLTIKLLSLYLAFMMRRKKQYLFCPGPVNVAANVLQAAIDNEIGHREAEFSDLFRRTQNNLLSLFEVKNKAIYFPVIITGSGSAANEAVLSSIGPNKRVLVLANGAFGERLFSLSKLHNPHTLELKFGWGKPIDVARVERYIRTKNIDCVAMVHHETSTGMLNPIADIGKLTKRHKILFIVDAISSAASEKIAIEMWNIGFLTTSSSKAIASLPGLSVVIGKKAEFEKLKNTKAKTVYLDLYKFYCFAIELFQTPNTPAVQLFFALDQAITNILRVGVWGYRERMKQRALFLRAGLRKLGLSFLIPDEQMSNVLTTVHMPSYLTFAQLQKELRKRNIIVYNGKGPLADKVFQVANMGEITLRDIDMLLRVLGDILKRKTA